MTLVRKGGREVSFVSFCFILFRLFLSWDCREEEVGMLVWACSSKEVGREGGRKEGAGLV